MTNLTLSDIGFEENLFKKLGVGLWAFNISSGAITKKFTPRPKKILDSRRVAYILDKAFEAHIHN